MIMAGADTVGDAEEEEEEKQVDVKDGGIAIAAIRFFRIVARCDEVPTYIKELKVMGLKKRDTS